MASGTIDLGSSGAMRGQIKWSSTPNTATNKSEVTAVLQVRKGSAYTGTTGTFSGSLTVGSGSDSGTYYGTVESEWVTVLTYSKTVSHNSDGKGTCYIYGKITGPSGTSLAGVSVSDSKTVTLDTIPRAGSITAAPNFTDEENPKISYSNPAGSSATVAACISLDGSKDDIAYRNISATDSSYTFPLTEAERNVLRNACKDANSRIVRFYVRTTIGSNSYLSYLEKTLSIVNANPTVNPTVTDIDTGMIALTGDANKIVRYYSNPQYTTNATALKGATIKSYKITCGSQSLTTATGTFYNVESNSIKFTVTDSRGNSTTKTVSKTLVDYVKLTCNIGGSKPNAQGNFDFTVKGNYFNSTFGTVANTLNVYYRWKSDGDFSAWQPMTATKSGNTYTAVVSITGLDYQTTYTFQAYAVDKIATVYTEETPIKSIPVFDWSKDDFNVNVNLNIKGETVLRVNGDNNNTVLSANSANDGIFLRPNGTGSNEGQVYLKPDGELVVSGSIDSTGDIISRSAVNGASIKATGALTGGSLSVSGNAVVNSLTVNGRTFGANKVLWTGGWLMTAGHTATLSEGISKQPNGIVLVFSHYDTKQRDWGWSMHFIPKQLIALQPGCGCAFFNVSLANTNYACGKYLYINDTTITGDDTNSGSGTMNGLTYYNSNRVMRYVIGV